MNLIEQLGGYEAAKSKCDRANKESYLLLSVPVQNGFGDIYVYKVEAALLEYCRQHNIFEVGDKVVVLVNALGNKYTWIVKAIDGCMVQISQVGQPDEWVHFSEITHATDEITRGFK